MIRLALLVPTLASRKAYLFRLLARLEPQIDRETAVITHADAADGDAPIGQKRNRLLEMAGVVGAAYVAFVDDDDLLHPAYVSRVREVIDGPDPPDVIGFRLRYFVDGSFAGQAVHSYDARKIPTNLAKGMKRIERLPNHLNPVRYELAWRARFPNLNHGEDSEYANALNRMTPRPREHFIDDPPLYDYLFRSVRNNEVTNERRVLRGRR